MAKVIFKCKHIKGGNAVHKENMVEYIATRKGVQHLEIRNKDYPATKKQEEFIERLLRDFTDSKNLFEYEDYLQSKTLENASEFISMALEHNLDRVAKKENYVDYIANRPRAEKLTSHGLFNGGDENIVLSRVAKKIAEHEGIVWTPIISLRRDDAVSTGFDSAERWKDYLASFVPTLAESLKIPMDNFRWYAAFHNEGHHPHIHMICYSENPKFGFLDRKGIAKIKSGLLWDIFKVEMREVYAQQSMLRDKLRLESKKEIEQLMLNIACGSIQSGNIEKMLVELSLQLKCTTGKRVYGYLPPRIKEMVNNITDEIAKEPSIEKAYTAWYKVRKEIIGSYKTADDTMLPLSQQKEFKSIKNYIIAEADKLAKGEISLVELEQRDVLSPDFEPIEESEIFTDTIDTDDAKESVSPYVKWTDRYKQAREYLFGTDDTLPDFIKAFELLQAESHNGNILAVFDLGRMYADGLAVEVDYDTAQSYYKQALDGFIFAENQKPWKYLEYRIGKMFAQGLGTGQNEETAAHWFTLSANQKYKFAQYSLGGLYHHGKRVTQNYEKAFELYQRSAKQGFPYADYEVARMLCDGVGTEKNQAQSNEHFEKAFNGFCLLEKNSHDDKLQYRLGSMLQNGIGTEKDIAKAKEYYQKSAVLENPFACYALAKIILSEENPTSEEIDQAVGYLKTSAENKNPFALYSLAKLYHEGKYVKQDTPKAITLFTASSEQDNEWATYSLGKIYLQDENHKDISKAILWFSKSAEKNNQSAQYQLGKLYVTGEQIPKDVEKAIMYFIKSAEQGNQFAQYALGKLYLMGNAVQRDKEIALKWFTLSAEQGNEYAQFFIENIDKWKDPSLSFAVTKLMHHMSRVFENNQPQEKANMNIQIDSKRLRKLREKKMAAGHKTDDFEIKANY